MRMAAGPSSLVETPEALLIGVRSGGLRGPASAGSESGGGLPSARDRSIGESGHRDAAARAEAVG